MPKPKAGGATSLKEILAEMRGHGVILEDIRSQNRATMEALQATRAALEEKIDQVDRNSQARDAVLEAAVRQNSKDIRQNSEDILKNSEDIRKNSEDVRKNSEDIRKNSEDILKNSEDIRKNSEDIGTNSEDIRVLTTRVDALGPLDQRVSALERRPSR